MVPSRTAYKRGTEANLAKRERKLYGADFNYREKIRFIQFEKIIRRQRQKAVWAVNGCTGR